MIRINKIVILAPNSKNKSTHESNKSPYISDSNETLNKLRNDLIERLVVVENHNAVKLKENEVSLIPLPAYKRYNGVVMRSFDYLSLNERERVKAESSVVYLSALLGFVRFNEDTPNYRVDFTSKALGVNLRNYWENFLNDSVKEMTESNLVINLLTEDIKKKIKVKSKSLIDVSLTSGTQRNGHNAKSSKGELMRSLLQYEDPLETIHKFKSSENYYATIRG